MKRFNEYYDGVESVEIPIISTTDTKYYLPDIPAIKGKVIKRIQVPHSLTYTPGNRTMLSDANIRSAFLTIVNDQEIICHRIPLYYFYKHFILYPILSDIFSFVLNDTEKCYIEFSQSASLLTTESIFLNFFYKKPESIKKLKLPLIQLALINMSLEENQNESIYPLEIEIFDDKQTVFPFPDDEFLRNKKAKSIQLYADVSELVSATLRAPDDKTIIADSVFKKSFLVLQLKNGLKINNLALNQLTFNFHLENDILFHDIEIDWPKSYIKIANNDSLVANTVFYLLIHYKDEA
jgi:hypothetical protein